VTRPRAHLTAWKAASSVPIGAPKRTSIRSTFGEIISNERAAIAIDTGVDFLEKRVQIGGIRIPDEQNCDGTMFAL
jgi:hypothetical protein